MKNLPTKVFREIAFQWGQIKNGSFEQEGLSLLLVALRNYITPTSLIRELGDFLAHPEKDRGLIFDCVRSNRIEGDTIHASIVTEFDGYEMPRELGRVLKLLNVDTQASIEGIIEQRKEELLVSFLAILHNAKIVLPDKSSAVLRVMCFNSEIDGREKDISVFAVTSEEAMIQILSTPLLGEEWCTLAVEEIENAEYLRAARIDGKLELHQAVLKRG